jgi:LysM repeat protein
MRRITIGVGLIVIVLAVLGSQWLISRADNPPHYAPADPTIIDDMYARINHLRERHNLPPYRINQSLMVAAEDQAQWLVATGTRTHFRPDGSRPSTRAQAAGYQTADWCCGENYYLSIDATPDLVWNFWLWSPHHYLNLVNPRFDDVGLGWSTDGRRISYVLVFGQGLDSGTSIPVSEPTPAVTSQPVLAAGQTRYVVQRGDTLLRIAQYYGTTVGALAEANNLSNPGLIYAGQQLLVPGAGQPESVSGPAPTTGTITGRQTYIVQPGDTLLRIAQHYSTSIQSLVKTNGIIDPNRLGVGQVLVIPNPGSGFAGLPAAADGQCSGLLATSPTDGFPNGAATFYWSAPSGSVSSYLVEVFNQSGQLVASYPADAGMNSVGGDMSVAVIGRGVTFSWDVVALVDGQRACSSQRVTALREDSTP